MYIRSNGDEFVLVRTIAGTDGHPREVVLCSLGQDPELNLYFAIERGRHENPELWEGVEDFHALQALENHKRRMGGFKPSLVVFRGRKEPDEESVDEQ
ncbi:MAG: hypothetical protein LDL33_16115 [Desulfomonile sp.]|nr:hypothetical protein [Desulfomonile sp.]